MFFRKSQSQWIALLNLCFLSGKDEKIKKGGKDAAITIVAKGIISRFLISQNIYDFF